jgi:cryptochrome
MPAKYIYAPWDAPPAVQAAAGCVVGRDYPSPIVDAPTAGKACLARMKAAFDAGKAEKEVGASGGGKRAAEGGGGSGGAKKAAKKG